MASNPQHEPTMEEILASIRKIISEDSNEPAPAAAAPQPQAAAQAESDVLELTQEVETPVTRPAPPPPPEPVRPMPAAAAISPKDDVIFQTIEEPAPAPQADHSDIFSDRTRKAMDDAFSHAEPEGVSSGHDTGPMPGIDARTVEAVFEKAVREGFAPILNEYLHSNTDELVARMKPFIREWMDENFPEMIESAVRNEMARRQPRKTR